jgi:hypothetical protein
VTEKWDSPGGDKAAITNDVDDLLGRLIDGIDTAITSYYGGTDPSAGGGAGAWGATQLGSEWLDDTNAIGAGDGRGAQRKIWSKLAATPTYGLRTIDVRSINEKSPNVNKLALTSQSTTAFTDCDVSAQLGSYGARALAVLVMVEVEESTTPGSGVYAEFRADGVTTDAQEIRVYPQVAGIPFAAFLRIPLGPNGVFEYAINASGAGTFDLRVDILGWEERAS